MPDVLPEEMALLRHVEDTAHRVFRLYGYEEIRTPLFEDTRLFVRSIGESTDIVEKEMYTFPTTTTSTTTSTSTTTTTAPPGPTEPSATTTTTSITLRPEATAPVVRAVVEHELLKQKGFWKLYYVGPMFRKERPQAGRSRQFSQIGVEAVGSPEPSVDVESILLAARFFGEIGLAGVEVKLNTIGCPTCRSDYRNALREVLAPRKAALCDDCRARFDRNVFRILDCKREACKAIAQETPPMRDYLDDACRKHFDTVTALLGDADLNFRVDDRLVRGFDYYTRTVFELAHPALGARDAVCGGGRYDNLVEELGGPAAGCVGFAVGVVPTLIALRKTAGEAAAETPVLDAYVVAVNDDARSECFRVADQLRRAGVSAELDHERRSLKAQMRSANRLGARYTIVIGPDELAEGRLKLKNMAGGEEEKLTLGEVTARLSKGRC